MGGRFGSIQARSVKRTHKWVCHVVAAYPKVSPGSMNGSILLRWTVRDHRLNPGPRPSPLRRRPPDARPSPGKARPRRRPRRRRKGLVCHQARHRRAWCCLASTRNRPALKTPPRNSWHWPDVKLLRNIGRALLHRDQLTTRPESASPMSNATSSRPTSTSTAPSASAPDRRPSRQATRHQHSDREFTKWCWNFRYQQENKNENRHSHSQDPLPAGDPLHDSTVPETIRLDS